MHNYFVLGLSQYPNDRAGQEEALMSKLWAGVVVLCVGVMSTVADSTPLICGEHDEVAKALFDQFREAPRSVGQVNGQSIIEVFVSKDTGTWTIIATGTDGTSCLMASGQDWEDILPPPEDEDVASVVH